MAVSRTKHYKSDLCVHSVGWWARAGVGDPLITKHCPFWAEIKRLHLRCKTSFKIWNLTLNCNVCSGTRRTQNHKSLSRGNTRQQTQKHGGRVTVLGTSGEHLRSGAGGAQEQGRKIYLPCNRTVGAKLGFIEFESQFSEKSKVFMFFKSCNKLISWHKD